MVPWNCDFQKRQKKFRHLLHLNTFATQWHCPDNLPHSINGIRAAWSWTLPLQFYFHDARLSVLKRVPWRGVDKLDDEAQSQGASLMVIKGSRRTAMKDKMKQTNNQTYETDPPLLFPTLML